MRKTALGLLLFCLASSCFGQEQEPLCPRHIETPLYPQIARAARLSGKVTLIVTIDKDGGVRNVEAKTGQSVPQAHPLLKKYAAENMQHWTFAKPPSAPYVQDFVYDYELDPSLPLEGGKKSTTAIIKVSFDLPDRVTILANMVAGQTSESKQN